jgi:hypothetical protein
MGAVYRARDLTLDADVAVKRLDPEVARRVDDFRNEILLARRVTHPNVCRLHDVVADGDSWFITMEHVAGETLAERLRRADKGEPIDLDFALAVIRDVAGGLAAAHRVGVVHRDLKPGNVLLAADGGRAVIADFGIAVEVNRLGRAVVDRAGTRGYMSPEQAAGREIDARTDVFALGVLAHRMLAGELPPVAPTTVAVTEELDPPAAISEDIPAGLGAVIARCLRRDPADRYADAGEVLAALDRIDAPLPRRRRTWIAAGIAACAIAAIAVGALAWNRGAALEIAAPRQVVIAAVDASALDGARGDWLDAAFGRRLVNELEDAWALTARLASDPGPEPGAIDLTATIAIRGDPRGLAATVTTATRELQVSGETMQQLAEATAAAIVEASIAEHLRRPRPIDLALDGASNAEAWRLVRRSQRASVRQLWPRARELSLAALELDPGSVSGNLEHGWTFGGGDPEAVKYFKAALDADSERLSVGWRQAIAVVRTAMTAPAEVDRALAEAMAAPLSRRERWYFSHRAVYAKWYEGFRDDSIAHLESLEAGFPRSAGAAKLLANHYLARDDREARELALRHARIAVSRGADDVASRADLARALLSMDQRSAALEQTALIEAADEEDKRWAIAGGEKSNSLFDLYIALGDLPAADRAARRLEAGRIDERGHGQRARAYLDFFRGDAQSGYQRLDHAIATYDRTELTEFIVSTRRQLAAIAHSLGDSDRVLEVIASTPETPQMLYQVFAAIARYRTSGDRGALAGLEAAIARLPDDHADRGYYGLQIAAALGDWDRVLELEDASVRWRRHLSARYLLGIAREKRGDLEAAVGHHEKLAYHRYNCFEPVWSGKSLFEAARLRAKLGDLAGARRHYRAYLARLDRAPPSHAGVAAARRELARLGE